MTATFTLEDINKVAKDILATPSLKKVITFHATMGVGKTTLIKELVKELGVTGNSSSPTFSLVNEYESETGETIYHFDLYRLSCIEEIIEIGFEDYLNKEGILIILNHVLKPFVGKLICIALEYWLMRKKAGSKML